MTNNKKNPQINGLVSFPINKSRVTPKFLKAAKLLL